MTHFFVLAQAGVVLTNTDAVAMLKTGVFGAGAVFAIVAATLVGLIIHKGNPKPGVLWMTSGFLAFSVILVALGVFATSSDQSKEINRLKETVQAHNDSIDELKKQHEIEMADVNEKNRQRLEELLAQYAPWSLNLKGTIETPREGTELEKGTFDCQGKITGLRPNLGIRLYIAVERNGFIWPREEGVQVQGENWSSQVTHDPEPSRDGKPEEFSLALIATNKTASDRIEAWSREAKQLLPNGKAKGYSRMTYEFGMIRLRRCDALRIKPKPTP